MHALAAELRALIEERQRQEEAPLPVKDGRTVVEKRQAGRGTLRLEYVRCGKERGAFTTAVTQPAPAASASDWEALRDAVQAVGKGRGFVRIHRVREHLHWPQERFDAALEAARRAYAVELHGGDPSLLTRQELADSYTDAHGQQYLTLSWTERHPARNPARQR